MRSVGSFDTAFSASDTVTVFSAASTINAVTEIGDIFSKRNQYRLPPSFASSSALAKNIENGAPADIYISANAKWMNYLEQKQMIETSTRIDLLSNRIVPIVPADSSVSRVRIAPGFDLLNIIGNSRPSMGDPDHVPAGIYGKQALQSLGVLEPIENHVARSKDVRAALALVERGEAPVGLVRPDKGHIIVNGRTLFDASKGIHVRPEKRRIGYIFQDGRLFPHLVDGHQDGLTRLRFQGGVIWVPQVDAATGSPVRVRVAARSVAIALYEPRQISIQNSFRGKVTSISNGSGGWLDVHMDISCPLTARIASRAWRKLALSPGKHVFAIVKSAAVSRGRLNTSNQAAIDS